MRNTTLFVAICIWGLTGCMNQPYAVQGAPGASGKDGQSITGPSGPAGSNGSSCSVTTLPVGSVPAPNGGSLIACTNGSSSIVRNGTNGVNGTIIVPIQLCPGSTAHYPNVFVEEAFCIDNKLYAVYSIPNAFMTVLTPGSYRSDGIGSACNFTVTQNSCVLSY